VIGEAGTIGQHTVTDLLKRDTKRLGVVANSKDTPVEPDPELLPYYRVHASGHSPCGGCHVLAAGHCR
jgi:hypothetical protein